MVAPHPRASTRISFVAAVIGAGLAAGAPARAVVTALLEGPGITQGDDPVECVAYFPVYRYCASDAPTERVLSHDGLEPSQRVPLDFHLYLPFPAQGAPDGHYPLIVYLHGWPGFKEEFLEQDVWGYVFAGYAVLAYDARAFNESCGPDQSEDPACEGQWNHLADVRYEIRDTQYFAGLLVDERSDEGTALVDSARIGVTGLSYGGSQAATLAALRNRVVDVDGTVRSWTSPAGTPLQIAAAAPVWAWTDHSYATAPNGRMLDYAFNNAYRGPLGGAPFGVVKLTYMLGLLSDDSTVYAPTGENPDILSWYAIGLAGEPYAEDSAGPIVREVTSYHSAYYWLDPAVAPAPTLFNSGWADDLFPVTEPVRWIQRARALHPGTAVALFATEQGHRRAFWAHLENAKASVRAWFDHWLLGIGPAPGSFVRALTQECDGNPQTEYTAGSWLELARGEVRLESATAGTVLSSGGPTPRSATAFDPISGGNACATAVDETVTGTLVFDFPPPGGAGYTVLGSPTVIADLAVSVVDGTAADSMLAARLLDVDGGGTERLVARGVYRPDASGRQVFQLSPMGFRIAPDHHLQVELLGHEAPTMRPSNKTFSIEVANVDLRIPVAEAPDGQQIQAPAEKVLPPGYLPEPGFRALFGAGSALAAMLARMRRTQ